MKKTDEEIREFVKGHYYTTFDEKDEEDVLWEPFENHSIEEVEDMIEADIKSFKNFQDEKEEEPIPVMWVGDHCPNCQHEFKEGD